MSLSGIIARTLLGLAPAPAASYAFAPTAPPAPAHAAPTTPAAPAHGSPAPAAPTAGAPAARAAAAPVPPTASEVVDRIQQFYANIKQVTAVFRQVVSYETYGTSTTSDGTVWIMKPGKMRWDYVDKKKKELKKSFISNGTSLYVVEHDNKQVVKKNLQRDLMPVAVSFLYGKGDLKAEFTPALDTSGKYGEKTDVVVKLTPRQPSAQYKNLYLVASPTDFHVTQSVIVDASNNVNHFSFYGPDFTTPLKADLFEFNERSVKDYRVIDGDAVKDGAGGPGTLPAVPSTPSPADKAKPKAPMTSAKVPLPPGMPTPAPAEKK